MATVLEIDPEICRAVDRFHASSAAERRRVPRESFAVVQRIAQAMGHKVPEQTAFFPVKCHDLSTRGFSFIMKRRPRFESIVLALGAPPEVIYLAAEIRHCTDVLAHPSGQVKILDGRGGQTDGEPRSGHGAELGVLVGCEFTGRLEAPGSQESPAARCPR